MTSYQLSAMPREKKRLSLVAETCTELIRLFCLDESRIGQPLPPERQLAEDLGISRAVVREAIQRLAFQGLLEVRHGVGIKVAMQLHRPVNASLALMLPSQAARLRQSMEARLVIEPPVAEMAASRISPALMKRLKSAHRQLLEAESSERAASLDLEFHNILAQASGNAVLLLILDSMAELGRESRLLTMPHYELKRTFAQHDQIVRAIKANNAQAAAQAMKEHLYSAAQDLAAQVAEVDRLESEAARASAEAQTQKRA